MENTITTRFNELKQKATDQAFGVLKQPNRFSVETVNNARLFLADKSEKLKFSSRSFNDEIQNLVYFNSFINLNEQTGLFDLT